MIAFLAIKPETQQRCLNHWV